MVKKVLLSAYACEPNRGSEPGVGWAWANALSDYVDLTVVTRANNQTVIDNWYRDHGGDLTKPKFVYYDPPRWVLWLKKKRVFPVQFFYALWQMGISWKYRTDALNFDLIHHVTFNSMMMPGYWWWTKCPVILGPLGGTSQVGKAYRSLFGKKLWKESIRGFMIDYWTWLPWIRFSFNNAAVIFCANSETQQQVSKKYAEKAETMLETGIYESPLLGSVKTGKGSDEVRDFVWVGTIEPWKALSIALNGFALAIERTNQSDGMHLHILGTGSELEDGQTQVTRLGLTGKVTFHGWLSQDKTTAMIKQARALLFTSVKDTSGNVVLEAMAQGVPVICINHQGVGDMTTDETAIRVPPDSIENTIKGVADGVALFARNQNLANRMGAMGAKRISEKYTWEKRAEKMVEVYNSLLG